MNGPRMYIFRPLPASKTEERPGTQTSASPGAPRNVARKYQRRKNANVDTSRGRRIFPTDANRPNETNGSHSSVSAVQRQSEASPEHRRGKRADSRRIHPPRRV